MKWFDIYSFCIFFNKFVICFLFNYQSDDNNINQWGLFGFIVTCPFCNRIIYGDSNTKNKDSHFETCTSVPLAELLVNNKYLLNEDGSPVEVTSDDKCCRLGIEWHNFSLFGVPEFMKCLHCKKTFNRSEIVLHSASPFPFDLNRILETLSNSENKDQKKCVFNINILTIYKCSYLISI